MYKLYQYKPIKMGFVILCQNCNFAHLKNTLNSINVCYPAAKVTVVVQDKCEDYPKAIKGGNTLASMMNKGLKETASAEWNFIIYADGWIKDRLDIKYSYFIESNKDILYPISKTRSTNYNFMSHDNGMMIHKKAFADIGEFPDESAEISKLMWAATALEKGYKFKGVVGGRFFN
jgi:hypothetical protein